MHVPSSERPRGSPLWFVYYPSQNLWKDMYVGFGCLTASYVFAQQWVGAITPFFVVLMLAVNLVTYNVSGCVLIRILHKHQATGVAEARDDITGSKSASPFDVVIAKTLRSMFFLTVPSLATLILFFVTGVGNLNARPTPVYDPLNLTWSVQAVLFVQLIIGLMLTRVAWVTKSVVQAEVLAKTISSEGSSSPETKGRRSSKAPSRADLKDKALRMSQDVEMPQSPSPAVTVGPVADGCSKTESSLYVQNEADIV